MDSHPSDETLLLAVAELDVGAFRTLYERHAGWLAIRLARRCNDHDVVADAIQDTFVAVWQKPQGFRGDGDVAAWLWGIAIRRLVSRLRTRSPVAAVFEHAEAAPAAEDQVLLSVEYGDIGQALARGARPPSTWRSPTTIPGGRRGACGAPPGCWTNTRGSRWWEPGFRRPGTARRSGVDRYGNQPVVRRTRLAGPLRARLPRLRRGSAPVGVRPGEVALLRANQVVITCQGSAWDLSITPHRP